MPGAVAQAGFQRRVKASAHTLDVVYPPARVPASGTTPTTTPLVNPLLGTKPVPTLLPTTPVPSKPSVTGVSCLWYDQVTPPTQSLATAERRQFPLAGWREGTVAVAAVWLADVLVNPAQPAGPTVFTDCEAVVHLGRRYRVLGFDVGGSGGRLPYAGYLWLGSAE